MKNNFYRDFLRCFRRSVTLKTVYQIAAFLLPLACGYLLSALLEHAMAGDWDAMYRTAAATAAVLLAGLLPLWLLSRRCGALALRDEQGFREYLYAAYFRRELTADSRGELDVRLQEDLSTIADFYQRRLPNAIGGGLTLGAAVGLMLLQDWRLGLIFGALSFLQLVPTVVYEKWTKAIYDKSNTDEDAYEDWMLEGYNGIRTLKLYGRESWYMGHFMEKCRTSIRSANTANRAGAVENLIYEGLDNLMRYGVYIILGAFILFGGLDMAKTPLFIILSGYAFTGMHSFFYLRLGSFSRDAAVKRLGLTARKAAVPAQGVPLVRAAGLRKSFDGKVVLDGLSLDLRPGERVLLRGENGSGKTTALRILLGLADPDRGSVEYSLPPRDISFALQEEPEFHLAASAVLEAMAAAGTVDGAAAQEHLRAFGIDNLLDRNLSTLSQGERKKFYLAAALSKPSPLLVLDEPTNHLDAGSVDYLLSRLEERREAILVCSHDPRLDALGWSRVIHLKGGEEHE